MTPRGTVRGHWAAPTRVHASAVQSQIPGGGIPVADAVLLHTGHVRV